MFISLQEQLLPQVFISIAPGQCICITQILPATENITDVEASCWHWYDIKYTASQIELYSTNVSFPLRSFLFCT